VLIQPTKIQVRAIIASFRNAIPLLDVSKSPEFAPTRILDVTMLIVITLPALVSKRRRITSVAAKERVEFFCPFLYDQKVKAAAIGAGAVAGIVIGAVAAAALIGFGGKKGYDFLMAKNNPMGPVATNPLYTASNTAGTNALYKG